MEFINSKINCNLDTLAPAEEKFQKRYTMGVNILLNYKNELLKSDDPNYKKFLDVYERVADKTLLDFDRAFLLHQTVQSTKHLAYPTAECGVFQGGGSLIIANCNQTRIHYALDTYEGFPDIISPIDDHRVGNFSDTSFIDIINLFEDLPNIEPIKGIFSETLKHIEGETFSFVHVDVDLYQSTLECCEFFYPRVVESGIMLFDDYLFPDCKGAKKAVDEFFSGKEYPIVLPTFQAIVIKTKK